VNPAQPAWVICVIGKINAQNGMLKNVNRGGVSHKKQLFLQTKITMPAATIMFLGGWQAEKQIKITYYNN